MNGTGAAGGGIGITSGSATAVAAASSATGGAAGFAVLIRRGGGSVGAALTGSGALPAGFRPFTGAGVSANEAFDGTLMFR